MKWKRKIVVVLALAALAGALVYGFMPRAVEVESARVSIGPLRVTVDEEGQTRVIDRFTVSAPVAGYLERMTLREGDAVGKGDALAVIEPLRPELLDPRAYANAKAGVDAASSALSKAEEDASSARASADYDKQDYARKKSLFDKGIIALDEMQSAESRSKASDAALGSALFAVDVARHELESARTALKYSPSSGGEAPYDRVVVRSPVSGKVLRVLRESAGVVAEADGIIEVGDPAAIEVAVDVLSDDAVSIVPGMRVLFTRWGGGPRLVGKVRVVEPSGFTKISALGVEEQRVWVISDITSPEEEWERLGDGYRVEASFVLWEATGVLQVPESALFRHESGWAVFAAADGRARLRAVELGHRNGLTAEIISGLSEGDVVITHPDSSITDGTKIKPRE